MASLRPGEVVVDLGSGGGLDVFLAARKVGPTGRAIGIDMTPEMVERARRNARGIENVEFHLSTIEKLPLPDSSADVIISNCVINLTEDKRAVFAEMFRVLKPGGRVGVSDIALKKPLPAEIAESVAAYVGCIAGALEIGEYERLLKAAGFAAVQVLDSGADLNAYSAVEGQSACCSPADKEAGAISGCCAPSSGERSAVKPAAKSAAACCTPKAPSAGRGCCTPLEAADSAADLGEVLSSYNVNDYAASVKVFAVRP
jgi:hypothetical protein